MTPKEYQRKTYGLKLAQARVGGVLRGGFFDSLKYLFYYTANGHHCIPVEGVKDFEIVPKQKRLKQ